jgi:LysR family carnitine catabolism transcriptional activator
MPSRASRQPTLRQLRGFQAVAHTRNFSRAAELLALTQPALSAAVRDLEHLLDVELFERSTHHVELTAAGAALLPQVQWLLNSFAHGVDDMHRTLAGRARSLRLAALPSAMHLLAPPLARWQRSHPEVALTVRDLLNDDLVAALHAGEVDIALGAAIDLPAGIGTVAVGEDDLVAAVPGRHRLAERGELRWRDLKGERLALFARGSTYDLALAQLRQQGVALEGAHRLLYSESLYSLVRSGLAVGVISRMYTHGTVTEGLRILPLRAPAITRDIALMVREQPGPRTAAVADCFGHLVDALRRPRASPGPTDTLVA